MANPIYVKPKTSPVIRIVQIKEKFGGLRIHIKGSDEFINGVTSLAQSLAYKICENCGTNQDVITNKKGWYKTYCAKCRKKVTKY
jgi:translation initiation factor 1 (eIF-1/SUI1)